MNDPRIFLRQGGRIRLEVSRGPLQAPMEGKSGICWLPLNLSMKAQARIFVPVIPTNCPISLKKSLRSYLS